jgi:hypothetical protein
VPPEPSTSRGGSPAEEEEVVAENSPIEEVALTVPVGDDPSTPVLTFRMWVLGTASCALLSFLNQFFWYRKEPLTITAISAQIAVVPLGRLMAAALPERAFLRGTRWEFSLNPGPFNVKEHVLITIFANSGAGTVYAIHVITAVRVFYGKHITFFVSLLVVLTTQVSERWRGKRSPSCRVVAWRARLHYCWWWRVWRAGAGVRVGGNIPAVSGGAGGDVVAVQPRAGLAVQVLSHLTQLAYLLAPINIPQQTQLILINIAC